MCVVCGQSVLVPTEDLQALTNQGVLPETLDEGLDFIPIADAQSLTEVAPQSTVTQQPSSPPPPTVEMAPPKAPVPSLVPKRKSTTEEAPSDAGKKPRRTAKSRQVKRSKI